MKLLTPFYSKHLEHKGTLIDFMGWQIPLMYTSVEEEYRMVRERAGFTDYSFQSALAVVGRDSFNFLQRVAVNDLGKISPGKMIYTSMLDETGAMIDDTTIFWLEERSFIVNGLPTKQKTFEWLNRNSTGYDISVVDMSTCFLALQGPKSREILQKEADIKDLPYFNIQKVDIRNIPVLIARAGFTGELGYELYIRPEYAHELWDTILELGKDYEIGPYGLASMIPMAIEKGYLYELDFYQEGTPLEYGLGWTVAFDKGDFIGKEALLKRKDKGFKTRLIGFEVADSSVVVSTGDRLMKHDKAVGQVTNATLGPAIAKSIGRGWVEAEYVHEGEELEVEHLNKRTLVKVASNYRWYDPHNKIIKG